MGSFQRAGLRRPNRSSRRSHEDMNRQQREVNRQDRPVSAELRQPGAEMISEVDREECSAERCRYEHPNAMAFPVAVLNEPVAREQHNHRRGVDHCQ